MIRCNNCEATFKDQFALSLLIEASDEKGNTESFLRDITADLPSFEDWDSEEIHFEDYRGCPHCLTDKYLMEV